MPAPDFLPLVWPLVVVLGILIWSRRLGADMRPIVINVVRGVAVNAKSNAVAYAIAIGFGLSASLSAFIDVFQQMDQEAFKNLTWHQYFALWAKVLNPFVVAVLAYATQNKFKSGGLDISVPPVEVPPETPEEQPPVT